MLLAVALMAGQAAFDPDAAIAHYRDATRATIRCDSDHPDDVLVCGRRVADRWRMPLVTLDRDDPKNMPVMVERERLLARTNNCQDMSPFLVGCGKVGVGISTSGGVALLGEGPLAP